MYKEICIHLFFSPKMNFIAWSQALLELWRYYRSSWCTRHQVHPRHDWHTCSETQLSCDICCSPSSLQTLRCCSSLDCNLGSSGPRCSSGWICLRWPIQPGRPALWQQHGKSQCLVGWWYYVLGAPFKAFKPWQHCVFKHPRVLLYPELEALTLVDGGTSPQCWHGHRASW